MSNSIVITPHRDQGMIILISASKSKKDSLLSGQTKVSTAAEFFFEVKTMP